MSLLGTHGLLDYAWYEERCAGNQVHAKLCALLVQLIYLAIGESDPLETYFGNATLGKLHRGISKSLIQDKKLLQANILLLTAFLKAAKD